jgi:chemotaxis protein MotB
MAVAESGRRRRRGGAALNPWPGYVDALSTLLMVLIFVLLVFVLAQGFLSVALSSRDQALDRLNRQVAELADLLALERGQAQTLRASLGRATEEFRAAASARDALTVQLRETREERDRVAAERDRIRTEGDRLSARIVDLELASRSREERITALERQLVTAQTQAEAAGGGTAQAVQRLTQAGRSLVAEQQARQQAETRAAELDRALAESSIALETARRSAAAQQRTLEEAQSRLAATERQVATLRQEAAALDRQLQLDRHTLAARLSELARLSEEVRALTALRDQLERQAREAEARGEEERRRRETAERAAAEQRAARERAEGMASEQDRLRRAAEQAAAEEGRLRRAAERGALDREASARDAEARAAEATRLGESARAQVALLTRQIDELRDQFARLAAALDAAESAGREKDTQIDNLGGRLNAALAARVEELQRYRSDFFGRLRDVLGERPEIRVVGDRFVFQSEVLFPPASAELSERGQQQIRDIAGVLREIASRIPRDVPWVLRVDGHADRIPIRSARFASNWELSAARAIAVAQLLIGEGLPASRIAAAAFGDNQPLDDRDTAEALARNRRIELRLTDR